MMSSLEKLTKSVKKKFLSKSTKKKKTYEEVGGKKKIVEKNDFTNDFPINQAKNIRFEYDSSETNTEQSLNQLELVTTPRPYKNLHLDLMAPFLLTVSCNIGLT